MGHSYKSTEGEVRLLALFCPGNLIQSTEEGPELSETNAAKAPLRLLTQEPLYFGPRANLARWLTCAGLSSSFSAMSDFEEKGSRQKAFRQRRKVGSRFLEGYMSTVLRVAGVCFA